MNKLYEQNSKKPGDEGFVYDVEEDFEGGEDNDWDMEDEDDIV